MTVPLTKVALVALEPGWLAATRFALAALPLAWIARRRLRAALAPRVVGSGALGYGVMLVLQNAGIDRTSVTHAALITGAAPVAVMALTVALRRGAVRPAGWIGGAVTLCGVIMVAADGAGSATMTGDAMVLGSVLLSAVFMISQPTTLAGRDPLAVTAVQFGAAALVAAPVAVLSGEAAPTLPAVGSLAAVLGLVVAGTIAPFALFAYAQARVTPATASVFLNVEPVVGAAIGIVVFANPFGLTQVLGSVAVVGGILLTVAPARSRHGASVRGAGQAHDARAHATPWPRRRGPARQAGPARRRPTSESAPPTRPVPVAR